MQDFKCCIAVIICATVYNTQTAFDQSILLAQPEPAEMKTDWLQLGYRRTLHGRFIVRVENTVKYIVIYIASATVVATLFSWQALYLYTSGHTMFIVQQSMQKRKLCV